MVTWYVGLLSGCILLDSRFCLLFQVVCLVDVYFYIVDSMFISSSMFSRCILLYSRFCLLLKVVCLVVYLYIYIYSRFCLLFQVVYLIDVYIYIVDSVCYLKWCI